MKKIILASSSPARKQLLERLNLPFETISPNIDETPHQGEDAITLAKRLSFEKAKKIASQHPDAIVIASDQVGVVDNTFLHKPMTHERAIEQLKICSGKCVDFNTGLCVMMNEKNRICCENYKIHFRKLTLKEIENYLQKEKPYECSAGIRSEGLAVSLFERFEGDDPNSLIGLPLIKLTNFLREFGLDVLS